MPMEHAAYLAKPEYIKNKNDLAPNTAPCYDDPMSGHRLSYLNGGGCSGKTTRLIKLFRTGNPLFLTPTHRLAKEMRGAQGHRRSNRRSTSQGVKAQTYHSFFRWSGQTDWTPERMGQKLITRVIIWDEVSTVPLTILKTFLTWLEQRGVQVICCGDQGQPPPIAGESPHAWLSDHADYYEEVEEDYRAKDPLLKALKKRIRLRSDKIQCQEMRKALPVCIGW